MAQIKILITSGSSFTIPSDWNISDNTIECWAAGGGGQGGDTGGGTYGGAGGGGGEYRIIRGVVYSPNDVVNYSLGSGGPGGVAAGAAGTDGGDTSWGGIITAKGGKGATAYNVSTAGGSGGTGGTGYNGGNGGQGAKTDVGGAGGGAAGPNGAGGNASGTTAGSGDNGQGGAENTAGSNITYNRTWDGSNLTVATGTVGSGGGGDGQVGALYGAGGSGGDGTGAGQGVPAFAGANGMIIVTYNTATDTSPTQAGSGMQATDVPSATIGIQNESSPVQVGTSSWTAIAAGHYASAAIRVGDGALFTWGNGTDNILGSGTTTLRSSPVQVGTLSWTAVSMGTSHAMAISKDGSLFTWGLNTIGQMGLASPYDPSIFTSILKDRSWTDISVGANNIFAIRSDGALFTWGTYNTDGTLGLNNTSSTSFPTQIGSSSWIAVSSASHTVAIRAGDRALFAWGNNTSGQLGDGTTLKRSSPVKIGSGSWAFVSASPNDYTMAITTTGALFSWGSNASGQLGSNITTNRSSPAQVGTSSWTAVYTPSTTAYGVRTDNKLFAWGANSYSQVGDSTTINRSSPVQIGADDWISVAGGANQGAVVGLKANGEIYSWGYDPTAGLLGNNKGLTQPYIDGTASPDDWLMIAIGGTTNEYALGIKTSDGSLWGWGSNNLGQLGLGNTSQVLSYPVRIGTSSWIAVTAGGDFSMAIRAGDRALFTWGKNDQGQLGSNTTTNRSSPAQVGTSSWIAVTAGLVHSLATRLDGSIFAWGLNSSGQLGDLTNTNRSSPVPVGTIASPTRSFTAISAGASHSVALSTTGELWTWGSASQGQIGDGTVTSTITGWSTARPVINNISWQQISVGGNYALGIAGDGSLWAWGTNTQGQLGSNSTTTFNSYPTKIGTSSWYFVSAGQTHAAAIRAIDGGLFTWGYNLYGQLGSNTTTSRSSPAQVGTSSWIAVCAANLTTFGITITNTLFGWGSQGTYANLGDGTTVNRSSPTALTTVTYTQLSWTAVSSGLEHVAAVTTGGALFTWGSRQTGQIGDGLGDQGATNYYSSPIEILSSISWTSAAIGYSSIYTIASDGGLWTAGLNSSGQLGDGTTLNRIQPNKIGASSWIAVTAGPSNVAAIRVGDRALFTWGNGANGKLGSTATVSRSSPAQVGTSSWTVISASDGPQAGITIDGTLWIWGSNGYLLGTGDNTNNNRSSPVQVAFGPGATASFTMVSVDVSNLTGITTDNTLYTWGDNTDGQIGDNTVNTTATQSAFLAVWAGAGSWQAVASSGAHTLAITADGGLWAWGTNAQGQLGDNTAVSKSYYPVKIGTSSWIAVATGGTHSLAIRAGDRALFAWGNNSSGQVGNNTAVNRSSPVQIGTSSWIAISAGNHSVGITINYALFAWGANAGSQLGDTSTINKSSPVNVGTLTVTPKSWTAVAAGATHTVAVTTDQGLWAWGNNTYGQLGDGTVTTAATNISFPVVTFPELSWTDISAGTSHVIAVRSDFTLWAWGRNDQGQLGLNSTADVTTSPLQVGASSWIAVSAGNSHSAAIRAVDRALFTWGLGSSGQLGGATSTVARSSPVSIGTSSWIAVSSGNAYTMGLTLTGAAFGWGLNSSYQLGDGTSVNRSSPVSVASLVDLSNSSLSFTAVAAAATHTAALSTGGNLWVWGTNTYGQIDNVVTTNAYVRVATNVLPNISWKTVVASNNDATDGIYFAIASDGGLWAWGNNASGQLGNNSTVSNVIYPVKIGSSSWVAVATGLNGTAAIRAIDFALFTWGSGTNGLLGSNAAVSRSSPAQVGTSSWVAVSVGSSHSAAIRSGDFALFTWGSNTSGNLGQNTSIARSSPVQIGTSSWIAVSCGTNISMAIRSGDFALFAWGLNSLGQLGINTTVVRSSPVQIGTSSWTSVSAGNAHTAGITITTGALFTWGLNSSGQLGDGTTVNRSNPVQIGSSSWTSVSAGLFHISAIRQGDNTWWGAGLNNIFQLGDNTQSSRSTPVQVSSGSYSTIASGCYYQFGITSSGSNMVATAVSPVFAQQSTQAIPKQVPGSWKYVDVGADHTVSISGTDALWTRGRNNVGQLGLNDTVNRSSPVQVGADTWYRVNANQRSSTLAIRLTDYSLWAWGDNTTGKLGLNDTVNRSSPVQVGSSSFTAVSTGQTQTVALRAGDSSIVTLGGLTTIVQYGNKTYPDRISATSTFKKVGAGTDHSIAIDVSDQLWTWGRNQTGQIGDSTTINRSSPVQIGSDKWQEVESMASLNAMAGIRLNTGALFAWGDNSSAYLGLGDTVNRSSPVQIGSSSWIAVSAGNYAIRNGDFELWGGGLLAVTAQIGSKSFPYRVDGPNKFKKVVASGTSTFAIDFSDNFFAWGRNAAGELGQNDVASRSSPVKVGTRTYSDFDAALTSISPSESSVYAIEKTTGALYVWGSNRQGNLGLSDTASRSSPVQASVGKSMTFVAAGNGVSVANALAITTEPKLQAFGGFRDITGRYAVYYPTQVSLDGAYKTVSAGFNHTLALTPGNKMIAWGSDSTGQLGDLSTDNKSSPVQIGTNDWLSVNGGGNSSVALRMTTGELYAWGNNSAGNLGLGDSASRSSPVQVGSSSFISVSAGASNAVAIRVGDSKAVMTNMAYMAGAFAEVGDKAYPFVLPGRSWTAVSAGNAHTVGITITTGALFTWGLNDLGQLGQNDTVNRSSPVQVGTLVWSAVAAGISHTAGIRGFGFLASLHTWGVNDSYQLGDHTTINRSSPVLTGTSFNGYTNVYAGYGDTMAKIGGGNTIAASGGSPAAIILANVYRSAPVKIGSSSWTAIAGNGSAHLIAVRLNGTLFSWGLNSSYQLGLGDTVNRSSPVSVGASNISKVAAGYYNSLYTDSNSKLYIAGSAAPWLDLTSASTPSQVGSSSWISVSAGPSNTIAIRAGDRALFTWGDNQYGQLGTNNAIYYGSPVKIGSDSWKTADTGYASAAVRITDGALFTWGKNTYGTLGDSTTINRSSPVQMGAGSGPGSGPSASASSWQFVSAEADTMAALDINGMLWTWGLGTSGQLGNSSLTNRSSPVQIGTASWSTIDVGPSTTFGIKS